MQMFVKDKFTKAQFITVNRVVSAATSSENLATED